MCPETPRVPVERRESSTAPRPKARVARAVPYRTARLSDVLSALVRNSEASLPNKCPGKKSGLVYWRMGSVGLIPHSWPWAWACRTE